MSQRRSKFTLAIFLLLFSIIIARLFYWQVIKASEFKNEGESQSIKSEEINPIRGKIKTSDNFILADSVISYNLYIEPQKILQKDQEGIAQIAEILKMRPSDLLPKLEGRSKWLKIGQDLSPQTKDALEKLNTSYLHFEKGWSRQYFEASVSAQLLGFVGKDKNGEAKGYFGLEGFYDRDLRGKKGLFSSRIDAKGVPIIFEGIYQQEAQNGRDLVLALDLGAQFIVENRLKEGIKKYEAKEGSVVVMDSESGRIVAMASFPNYDPKEYFHYDGLLYKNPVVNQTFEPGSIFKPIIMAAAINEGIISKDSIFPEEGPMTIGDYQIRTWNNQYRGKLTATQILEKSSNVGMVQVIRKIGKEKALKYLKKFGFGESSDIDLEDEQTATLRNDSLWRDLDLATVSFGQGIAVTPIQMVTAFNALVNQGKLMTPKVVAKIQSGEKIIEINPRVKREVITPKTSSIMIEMLEDAVNNGEAKWIKYLHENVKIGGKTGTAQIPIAGHYDESKTIASFIGFAPSPKPRFTMLLTLKEPGTSPWASETAAPLWLEISKELIDYFNINI